MIKKPVINFIQNEQKKPNSRKNILHLLCLQEFNIKFTSNVYIAGKREAICLNVNIYNLKTRTLIDSGSQLNLITQEFVIKSGLLTEAYNKPIRLADSSLVKKGIIVKTQNIIIIIGSYQEDIKFEVLNLGKENIILG